ncbi:MAG TPA: AI-2E family transporter, partial [Planctomycetota bacterium]|nr:AI-2E family transporter [Planctomycetota bacterium]
MIARWRRIAFPVLALLAILLLASTLSSVLNPVLIAMLLAVLLNPVVNLAARAGLPRVVSVALLYVALTMTVVWASNVLGRQFEQLVRALSGERLIADYDDNGLIELAGPGVERDEFEDLDRDRRFDPGALLQLENWLDAQLGRSSSGVLGATLDTVRAEILASIASLARPAGEMAQAGYESVMAWAGGVWHALTLLVLIPFYLFFFLVEYPAMVARLRTLVPPRHREQVDRITRDVGRELVAFLRGRVMCGLIKAVLLWAGMVALGIPFAPVIALVSGLLSLLPFVGFVVGVLPASVIALTMPGGGTASFAWVLGLFIAAEALEAAVLYPLVLGRETGLHPVTLVIVLLAGGALMGTLGVLVAIPLALIMKVLWLELVMPLYRAWAYPTADEGSRLIVPAEAESPAEPQPEAP